MRIRTLWAIALAGKAYPPAVEVDVPTHLEARARLLLSNGSVELVEASPIPPPTKKPDPTAPGAPGAAGEGTANAEAENAAHTGGTDGGTSHPESASGTAEASPADVPAAPAASAPASALKAKAKPAPAADAKPKKGGK